MKNFLVDKYGLEEGTKLHNQVITKFNELIKEETNLSKQQEKVLKNLLLPRISLYKVLLDNKVKKEEALNVLEEHMKYVGATPMRKKYEQLDKLPCAFALFKFGFTQVVSHSNLWESNINKEKDQFDVTMKKCFWHETFKKYGCPELCKFACLCDDLTYNDLNHIKYSRTQTLGTGGTCCDFHFEKRKK